MQRIKLSNNLSFSRIIQGFWRLTEWNLTPEELVKFIEDRLELGIQHMIQLKFMVKVKLKSN